MAKIEELKDNDLVLEHYAWPNIKIYQWPVILSGVFIFTFFSYFPIGEKIQGLLQKQLASIPDCSITYQDMGFGLFFPKVIIKDLNVEGGCISQSGEGLDLSNLQLIFKGPSFSPVGVATELQLSFKEGGQLKMNQSIGLRQKVFNLTPSHISFKTLSPFMGGKVKLLGDIEVSGLISMDGSDLSNGKFSIKSTNAVIPAQNISDFNLPALTINHFLLNGKIQKAKANSSQIVIEKMILGDDNSPLKAQFSGIIHRNKQDMSLSSLELKGEIVPTPALLDKVSILRLLLQQYQQRDGAYQVKLIGTLGSPQVVSN